MFFICSLDKGIVPEILAKGGASERVLSAIE